MKLVKSSFNPWKKDTTFDYMQCSLLSTREGTLDWWFNNKVVDVHLFIGHYLIPLDPWLFFTYITYSKKVFHSIFQKKIVRGMWFKGSCRINCHLLYCLLNMYKIIFWLIHILPTYCYLATYISCPCLLFYIFLQY